MTCDNKHPVRNIQCSLPRGHKGRHAWFGSVPGTKITWLPGEVNQAIKVCPRCETVINIAARVCPACGKRFR